MSTEASNVDGTPADVFLEDLRSDESMAWVTAENARALASIVGPGKPEDDPMYGRLRAIYDDKKKIPGIRLRGDFVYNFWQDEDHVKGIWRRTSMEDFKREEPEWETVLDVDALAKDEGKSWVWKGPNFLDYGPGQEKRKDRCVIKLSDGGTDACSVREFDVVTKAFIAPEDGGFALPESKNNFSWVDRDTVWVGFDFGEGTMSPSGYPLTVREWKRGTKLEDSAEIWRGEPTDVVASGMAYWDKSTYYKVWYRAATFYDTVHFAEHKGEMVKVDIPTDFSFGTYSDHVVIHCKSDWEVAGQTFVSGTVVVHPQDTFLAGSRDQFTVLYTPKDDRCTYGGSSETKDYMLIHTLENMVTVVYVWKYDPSNDVKFTLVKTFTAENCQSFSASGVDSALSNDLFVTTDGFLNPVTLSTATAPDLEVSTLLKTNTQWFDPAGMSVSLQEATSDDGTKVPYFLIKGTGVEEGGKPVPTVLYGYGGFEIPMTPGYSATVGEAFLSKGMCYVMSCIRGGGEFGPNWHRAAKKEKRWRAYEDFSSIAKDLVAKGITTPNQLGCMGGSNGGLLAGAMVAHYPQLFGAVVSQCPLLDMERYVLLTSGPSWIDEYGDPKIPEEKVALLGYSPYHNIEKGVEKAKEGGMSAEDAAAGAHIPATLFTTSTADDRVHPSHARRMVHRMRALGVGGAVLYHEMTEGGHAGAADNVSRAKVKTIENKFLIDTLFRGTRK